MALPVDALIPAIRDALRRGRSVVVEAPPGAGKTTRVPPALLAEDWLAGRRIILLEPRRLAARAAAAYIASALGEDVGGVVGYRMRMDTRVSERTRLEVVTEGVLTRMLHADSTLDGVGCVIFDEFHERSIHADTGLALCLQARALLRPDLRLIVMSATLEADPVVALLGDAERQRSEGRLHAVETRYLDRPREDRLEDAVAHVIRAALEAQPGDLLAFLPGSPEIRRTAERLAGIGEDIVPLYGDLPRDDQRRAIEPSPPGRRKVVLATSIAETSLTIEGVRIVVDGGLMRVPRFSARTGMTRLDTLRVTADAADQRRGRAGRTDSGVCYRLWTESENAGLVARRTPEILEADLAPLALDLAAWGVADPAELRWLDSPPAGAFAQARELLAELGALDAAGSITAHGRDIAALPAHPRIAHMLLRATTLGSTPLACDIAALLEDRDILRTAGGSTDADIHLRLDLLRHRDRRAAIIDHASLARARASAGEWRRRLGVRTLDAGSDATTVAGTLLALAYPDRIGHRRGARGRFLLRNGRGVNVPADHLLAGEDYIVAAQVGGHGRESTVYLGAPVALEDLRPHFTEQIRTTDVVRWSRPETRVRAERVERLGAIVLGRSAIADADPDRVRAAIVEAVRDSGLSLLSWSETASSLRARVAFLRTIDAEWPDWSDATLLATIDAWLGPWLTGQRSAADLARLDLHAILLAGLEPPRLRSRLDTLAPTHLAVPSGSRIAIDYTDPAAPAVSVRLQEMFGLHETPRIGGGTTPLTLRLLSPAMRPVQVTRDLASFWKTGYFDVRKDLRGRYPKHHWPDDPLAATPTRRARP